MSVLDDGKAAAAERQRKAKAKEARRASKAQPVAQVGATTPAPKGPQPIIFGGFHAEGVTAGGSIKLSARGENGGTVLLYLTKAQAEQFDTATLKVAVGSR